MCLIYRIGSDLCYNKVFLLSNLYKNKHPLLFEFSMKQPNLNPISLKYIDKDYETAYIHHSNFHTTKIFNFFILYMLLAMLISLAKNIHTWNILFIFRTILMTVLFVLMVQTFKKFGEKHKFYLDFGFCFMVALIYVIHLKVFFPVLLDNLSSRSIFYLAAGLESFRVFLFISKINWMMIWVTNMFLNYAQYSFILEKEAIDRVNLFSFIFPLILANTLPFVSYFTELSFKKLFYKLVSFDRTLKSFEELINKILPNQVIILNERRTEILFCNEEVQKFYQSSENEQIFSKIQNINIIGCNLFNILGQLQKTEENFVFFEYQASILCAKTKEECFFDVKVGRIHWQNQDAYLILMADISAVKLVKKLKELDGYKDKLLATVSHDLRTPLNGLVGILELLSTKIVEKEAKKYLRIATRCSNLLLFMINDILDFSQISNGKLRLIFSRYHVMDLTKEVINLIKFQCQRKNIPFILDVPKDLMNQMLICDYRRVQQVLLNLLSNSLKFTSHGFIKLKIRKIIENGNRFIHFSVEDTGIGIKKEDLAKLFQLFGKLETENLVLNPSGVGLGLVISQHMVGLLSGDPNAKIEVTSEYENGATFSFKLPLNIPEEEEVSDEILEKDQRICDSLKSYSSSMIPPNLKGLEFSPVTSTNSYSSSRRNNLILLVDDDQINLFVIGKYLESFGINYKTACDGKQALDMVLKEKNFTFIMLDCYMPIMNGFEAAAKIKELAKRRIIANIPILALTASTSNKDIDQCKQSGMDEYLPKPVSRKQMKEKLQQMLNISILERNGKINMVDKLGTGLFFKNKKL